MTRRIADPAGASRSCIAIVTAAACLLHIAAAKADAADAGESVGRVETEFATGTAFVVGEDLLVTNDHVIDGASQVTVTFSDGTVGCTVSSQDYLGDLATLACETGDHPPLTLNDELPPIGANVTVLGYPGGSLDLIATRGIVSAPNIGGLIRTDAALNPGNSGGPLLDDDGGVVGIATLRDEREDAAGFAIPATTVRAFIGLPTRGSPDAPAAPSTTTSSSTLPTTTSAPAVSSPSGADQDRRAVALVLAGGAILVLAGAIVWAREQRTGSVHRRAHPPARDLGVQLRGSIARTSAPRAPEAPPHSEPALDVRLLGESRSTD